MDEVTIVTGAAGGMGAAIAALLAAQGRSLILADLHAGPLEALAASLDADADIAVVANDVSDPGFPARIVAALDTRRIGALVHAAAVTPAATQRPSFVTHPTQRHASSDATPGAAFD